MSRPRLHPERVLTPAEKQRAYRQRQAQARSLQPLIPQIKSALETARAEMESFKGGQEGERGAALQEKINTVYAAIWAIEDATP